MKKNLNQLICLTLLSFCLLLFYNCTFDDDHLEADGHHFKSEMKLNRLNLNQLNKKAPKLSSKIKTANDKGIRETSLYARTGDSESSYTINTDEIIEIIKNGKTTYTFSLTREGETHLTENLVVSIDANGGMYGKIIVYDLTDQDKTKIEQKQAVDLDGKMSFKEVGEIINLEYQLSALSVEMSMIDCLTFETIGGSICPSGDHDLRGMRNGQCFYVNNGSFIPDPETIVQIIADQDCLNGNQSGPGDYGNEGDPYNPGNFEPIGGGGVGGNGGNTPSGGYTPQETNPNEQNPNEQNPTDASQDIGDGSFITTPFIPDRTPNTPCGQLKKLNSSPNYYGNIDFLKEKAAGSKEYAWVYKYFPNSTSFAPPTVAGHNTKNPNIVDLDAFNGIEWIGAFHNHTQGNKPTQKMFSPGDVIWLLNKALRRNSFQPPSTLSQGITELFLGLVNENETYCLKIKDWNKFYTLKDKYEKFKVDLELAYKNSGNDALQSQLQKVFLKNLNKADIGIGLYEQDSNGNWSEINLDLDNPDNDPIKTPCN